MPYWTYILQSATSGHYYCGFSDNVDRRALRTLPDRHVTQIRDVA